MDPFTLIIMAGIAVTTAVIGELSAAGERAQAEELRQRAMKEFDGVVLPPIEVIQAEMQGDTEMRKVDPRLRQAQMDAYEELLQVGRSGEMRLSDRARLNQFQSEMAGEEKGQREALRQSMAARGQSGGGMEYAALLGAQQGSANRSSQQGMDAAAMAQDAAYDSLIEGGRMAGDLRGQDLSIAAQQDNINSRNIDRRYAANVFNIGQKQWHHDADMDLRARRAGLGMAGAQGADANAARTQQKWAAIGDYGNELYATSKKKKVP